MRRTRLVFAPSDPQAPPAYLLLDAFGEVVGRGEQPLRAEAPAAPTTVVLVVPGVEATARWLRLPARGEAQARAAAALLLEGEQALEDEPVHLALGPLEADGCRLAVTVARSRMQGWLDLARLHGISPDVVAPDCLLIPEPEGERPVAARIGGALAVRGRRLAFACDPDLAPVLLQDRDPELASDAEAVERLLAQGAGRPTINLLQGEFAPADGRRIDPRDLRRAGVLAALLLASPMALEGAEALRLSFAADRAEAAARQDAAAVLPKGTVVRDPAVQVAARLERLELAAGGGPAGLAARLFAALSGIEGAQVESLIVSPDGALRASITHANYSDMELLGGALRGDGIAFKEEGTRDEAGGIVSEVMLGVRR